MSELKPYIGPHPTDHTLTEYYLKSKADKVIAEKDTEIDGLKERIEVLNHQVCKMNCAMVKHYNEVCDDLILQKYKRCLAMADMCSEAVCYWDNVKYTFFKGEAYCFRKLNHYGKWGQIWLAIAEKFKEGV